MATKYTAEHGESLPSLATHVLSTAALGETVCGLEPCAHPYFAKASVFDVAGSHMIASRPRTPRAVHLIHPLEFEFEQRSRLVPGRSSITNFVRASCVNALPF